MAKLGVMHNSEKVESNRTMSIVESWPQEQGFPKAGPIEQLAQRINRWNLTLPVLLFLEIAKPFSFIVSQGLLLCQPLVGFFYEDSRVTEYADLIADRTNLEHLIVRLEQGMPSRDDGGGG
jgi:hypothetical protein